MLRTHAAHAKVFCQSAIKGAERDQEMVVQSLIMDKQQLKQSLAQHAAHLVTKLSVFFKA